MNRHRFVVAVNLAAIVVLAACQGCKDKTPVAVVVIDSGPPPVVDAAPAEVLPLDTIDASVADANDGAVKKTGPGLTQSQLHAKQCCNALRAQAKALGSSPEGAQLLQGATLCDTIAMNLGPSAGPQAPEMAPLRAFFMGKPTVPAVCSGL